ncbi:MAG: hypothetical protein M3N12_09715 [Verrucomicrobiota bacterium]|nr:hypothetical protein [Verrucomicrobiota bacterium]
MHTTLDAAICVNGHNYENVESMPENIRQGFERVVAGALKAKRSFFVGRTARFIPMLRSRIVCDSAEFSDSRQMPSADRREYEDLLSAMLPGYIAARVAQSEARLQRRNKLVVALTSLAASSAYLGYHGCFDAKFLYHFLRFLFGLT